MSDPEKKALTQEELMNYLYAKTYACPVCNRNFMDFAIRRSRLRQIGIGRDFRMHYEAIDPNLYEVTLCSNCGYAALHTYFNKITPKQQEIVQEKITPNFKYKEFSLPLTPNDALTRFKMALACAQAIGAKASQKAVICLKMAWIYRDAKEERSELMLLKLAYSGFKEAFVNENFPLDGMMDESTVKYVIAELGLRLGEHDEALRMVGDVIVSKATQTGLKEKAQDLKELIKEAKLAARAGTA